MTQENELQPLTLFELIRKNRILEAYYNYWNSDLPITPHFNLKELHLVLEEAAEVVARVRNYIDTVTNKDQIFTLRTHDGMANSYLLHTENNPTENRDKFLRELIAFTLSTDSQFEDGVTNELIDQFIGAFQEYKTKLFNDQNRSNLQSFESYSKDNLFLLLNETNHLAKRMFEDEQDHERDHAEDKIFLKSFVHAVENLYLHLVRYDKNSKFNHAESDSSSELGDLEDFVIVPRDEGELEESSVSGAFDQDIRDVSNQEKDEGEQIEKDEREIKEEEKIVQEDAKIPGSESSKASGIKIAKIEGDIQETLKELEKLRDSINSLEVNYSDPKLALKGVEDLLKRCLYWGEALMKDLITLDQISSENPEPDTHAVRKKQAIQLQSLMDKIDELKAPLKKHQSTLSKLIHEIDDVEAKLKAEVEEKKRQSELMRKRESEEQKEKDKELEKKIDAEIERFLKEAKKQQKLQEVKEHRQRQPKLSEQTRTKLEENDASDPFVVPQHENEYHEEDNAKVADKITELEDEEADDELEEDDEELALYYSLLRQWQLLKLQPKFENERQRGRFVISAHIPGMKEEDFDVQINRREGNIVISGCRLPSRAEFEKMKENLLRRFGFHSVNALAKQLFRYGFNRFGAFTATFPLPQNVLASKIVAKYENGILNVLIPFRVPVQTQQKVPVSNSDSFYSHNRSDPHNSPNDFYSPLNFLFK